MLDAKSNSNLTPQKLRQAAGCFATGVTVVALQTDREILALTASSFVSISLDPPLVMVSVDQKTKLHLALKPGLKIGISILAEDQVAISNHFAGIKEEPIPPFSSSSTGAPWISHAHATYSTTISKLIKMGDHTSLLCLVDEIYTTDKNPLIFYRSQYRRLNNPTE